jgi:uncharacterized linocin/CFP29 family protein
MPELAIDAPNAPVITEGGPMQVDTIQFQTNGGNGYSSSGSGPVAQRLLQNGFNINSLRTNGILRRQEWIAFDNRVMQVARMRLIGVQDLMSRGLVFPLNDALGITRLEWQRVTGMTPAEVTMSGIPNAENDRMEFDLTGMPIPIIHKDFNLNIRQLAMSRRTGQPIDTMQAALSSRIVTETVESILFKGFTGLGANNAINGYLTAPNRNTGSVTANWATATGVQIVGDILAMIQKAYDDHMYGPFVIYIPLNVFTNLGRDYATNYQGSIFDRIRGIPGITDIKASENLTGTSVLLVQMTDDVVDEVIGFEPTLVEWETHGGMVSNFKVMAIMLPRVRSDAETQSGIVHYS